VKGDKESPDVIGGRDKMRFDELGVGRTGFHVIAESTLDD